MNICILIMVCNSQTSTVIRYILCTCTVVSVSLTPEILSADRISVLTLFVFILYDVCIFLRHHKQSLLMTSLAAFCITTSICAIVCSYIFVDSTLGIVLDSVMIMAAFILSVPNVYWKKSSNLITTFLRCNTNKTTLYCHSVAWRAPWQQILCCHHHSHTSQTME